MSCTPAKWGMSRHLHLHLKSWTGLMWHSRFYGNQYDLDRCVLLRFYLQKTLATVVEYGFFFLLLAIWWNICHVLVKSDRSLGYLGDWSQASSSYPVEQEWGPRSLAWRRTYANAHCHLAVSCLGCIQLRLRASLRGQVAEETNLRLLFRALA